MRARAGAHGGRGQGVVGAARAAGPLCIADNVHHCDGGCASSTATPGCRPPDSHPLRLPPHGQQQFLSRVCPSSLLLHSGASVCTGDTCSGWGVQGCGTDRPCGSHSVDRWPRSRSPLCLLSQLIFPSGRASSDAGTPARLQPRPTFSQPCGVPHSSCTDLQG